MKKSLLSIVTCVFAFGVSHAQPVQPPNQSFEIWQTYNGSIGNTYDEPVDWNTGNECSEILNQLAVTESSDAYSGASSARLETLPAFGNIKINGVLTTASMICSANSGGQEGGSPYTTEIPDSVVGFFKYAPMGSDSAYSQIMFLANNDMDTISYTRVNFTQAVGEWTRFSAALTPATGGQMPEKLSLLFSSSWGDGSQGEAVVGSVFYIDSVHFVSVPQGINDINRASNWSVYPNPVVGKLNVNGFTGETVNVEILDVTGKRVKYEKVKEEAATIDLSQLVAGIYLYQIKTLDQQVLRKGKLMVNP